MTTVRASVRLDWKKAIYALRARIVAPDARATVAIGILRGATQDVDDGNLDSAKLIAPYAAAQEFGTKHIPPRPFLRNTYAYRKDEWVKIMGTMYASGVRDPRAILRTVGEVAKGEVKETIRAGNFTPLSPKTIKAKERRGRPEPDKPLIDTASMINAIGYEVR